MGQQVLISSIVTRRSLELGDDIEPLAAHIRDSGLQVPILINQNRELIDGLRRLHAVRSLGNTHIEAVPVALYGPAVAWIERARVHGILARPLSPRRIWDMYEACKPLIALTRSREMTGRNHGRGVHIDGRGKFLRATGINSESYFQAVTQLYRTAREEGLRGALAKEAIDLMEAGKLTVYMGLEYVRTRTRPAEVVKADEQLTMLDSVVASLAGMGYGLSKLGPIDPSIPSERLADIAKELRGFRRQLHQLIKQLEREQDSS